IGLCSTAEPWSLGERSLTNDSELSSDNCFAVKFDVQRPAFTALVGRNSKGQLSLFHPTTCKYLDDSPKRLGRNAEFIYPARTKPAQVLGLDENIGQEHIYVLASADRQVQASITALTKSLPTICESQDSDPVSVKTWEAKLNAISKVHPGLFQWRGLTFNHVAPTSIEEDDEDNTEAAEEEETITIEAQPIEVQATE
ncbi:MAG: hypothetical protein HOM11_11310, partial [Methylococcales bacterium]|nr:hypothetical protein [Methylococcales bacterium]